MAHAAAAPTAAAAAAAAETHALLHPLSPSRRLVSSPARFRATTAPQRRSAPGRLMSRGVCCALKGLESSGSQNGGKELAKRAGRGRRPEWIEDDVYTVDGGWNVDFSPTEEMTKVGGIDVPIRITKQLQRERRGRQVAKKAPTAPPRATHKLLRVMAGRCAGKKLTSAADAKVRPMMEVVRGAVFNILKSLSGWTASSPSGRWLDLYSGTGSVAIEALSRGCCAEAHFVELDPWVIANVLTPNLTETKCLDHSVVHTAKVETWLQQASDRGANLLGGAFDYVSVTPPYEAVSYPELMAQLSESPLLKDSTFVVVEYPLRSRHEIPDSCGSLNRIRDRRYGRTNVVIYGPKWVERDDKMN